MNGVMAYQLLSVYLMPNRLYAYILNIQMICKHIL